VRRLAAPFSAYIAVNGLVAAANAFDGAETILAGVLGKARFWENHAGAGFNPRQRDMLNRLLDGLPAR
jgi:hypothetical protein